MDLANVLKNGADSRPFLVELEFKDFVIRQGSNQYTCTPPPETTRVSHASQGFTCYFISNLHVFDVVWSRPNNSVRFIRPIT